MSKQIKIFLGSGVIKTKVMEKTVVYTRLSFGPLPSSQIMVETFLTLNAYPSLGVFLASSFNLN